MFKWKPDHEMASMLFDKAGEHTLSLSFSLCSHSVLYLTVYTVALRKGFATTLPAFADCII